ncbi:ISL3 family transposase, partial [Candidatus Peregrinibacteria bacterium]|nr:ISL3 family transposase [Candidatus Peregrinibacteria bacterium]
EYDNNEDGYLDLENGWEKANGNTSGTQGEIKLNRAIANEHLSQRRIYVKNAFGPTKNFLIIPGKEYVFWLNPTFSRLFRCQDSSCAHNYRVIGYPKAIFRHHKKKQKWRAPMTMMKFISRTLWMKGFRAKDCWHDYRNKRLNIQVRPWKTGRRCSKCNRLGRIKRVLENRCWRDLRIGKWLVYFLYRPKVIICPVHGEIQESLAWAAPYSRITLRLEHSIIHLSTIMPQSEVADLVGMASSTVSDTIHRIINRYRENHRIRGLKVIGIDEISYRKGKKFATIVYDLDRGCVVWVGKGKGRETIDRFFEKHLSAYQRNGILFASCDMAQAYIGAIKHYCENAVLVIDRFHVAKALNEAMDEVRKEQWRELLSQNDEGRKALKGLRWILFRHSRNRSRRDRKLLKELNKKNNRIYRAWRLKDEFEHFWEYTYKKCAEDFLDSWITSALRSRLEPMRKFALTLRTHRENILAFIGPRITNAVAEGINRIVRMIKNRASGFRTLEAFSDIIYLVCGDVAIETCYPSKYRML